jgi:hypothetical protein
VNLGQAIVSDILHTGDIKPYLDAGLSEAWLRHPDHGAEAVLGDTQGNWFKAYGRLLRHHHQHGKVPSPQAFKETFDPNGALSIIDQDDSASELIALATERIKRAVAEAMMCLVEDAHVSGDLGGMEVALTQSLEILRNGLPAAASVPSTWHPLDLEAWFAGGEEPPVPTIGMREDGKISFLYARRTHALIGDSEVAKSFLAQFICAQEIDNGNTVGYLDFEDTLDNIMSRMVELVRDPKALIERFRYVHPEEQLTEPLPLIQAMADCSLVVVDGITEALELVPVPGGNSSDWNGAYVRFQTALLDPIAAKGPAVLSIDHPNRDGIGKAARDAGGAGHKRKGYTGASYSMVNIEPMGRGRRGFSKVYVAKDKPGQVRVHAVNDGKVSDMLHVADFVLDNSDQATATTARLLAPGDASSDWRPTTLMSRAAEMLTEHGAMSKTALAETFRGKKTEKLKAIDFLIQDGYFAADGGKLTSVRPYVVPGKDDEAEDEEASR